MKKLEKILAIALIILILIITLEKIYFTRQDKLKVTKIHLEENIEFLKHKKFNSDYEYCMKLADFMTAKPMCKENKMITPDGIIIDAKKGIINKY